MKLVLSDGTEWPGRAFGAEREVRGEVVFHTGLCGYPETLTDPSYRGQILVLAYPLQGNYGVPDAASLESARVQVAGLIIGRLAEQPSHHAATRSLADWLRASAIPAIDEVDTRALVRRLRAHGTLLGGLLRDDTPAEALRRPDSIDHIDPIEQVDMARVASLVEPAEVVELGEPAGSGPRILMIDMGAKESLLRALLLRGASVVRAPASAPWEQFLDGAKSVDGVFLGNGPGDPRDLMPLAERLRGVLSRGLPTLGVCLGHQVLALAVGASTYKLPYGHRSHNQPVRCERSGRAYITSQNHGYAVRQGSLPDDFAATFTNLNDGTNEGMRHLQQPFSSVQFHPEGAAGPRDTAFVFDDFLRLVTTLRRSRR
jgi:carbamoyl-phosphate synthase small subunit